MGLKKAENQVKILLADTIMALCRNTLNHHSEISVEGLLGITLDNDEIFLVSIDQTISNPDVPSKKRSLEKDSKQTDESKSKRAKDDEDTEIEDEQQQEKKSKRRKRRRSRRRGSNVSGGISSDNEDGSDSARPHSDHDVVSNDASFTDDQTNSGNNSSIRIKSETNEDDDEDLVIVKEELGDETIPSTADFPFMAQSFHNFQHLADSPLNNFQPHSSTQAHSQQSMVPSSQPQPGPSVNPPGVDEALHSLAMAAANQREPYGLSLEELTNQHVPLVSLPVTKVTEKTKIEERTEKKMSTRSEHQENRSTRQEDRRARASPEPDATDDTTKPMCPLCGKHFKNLWSVRRHIRCHTGQKNYNCRVCGKLFVTKWSVARHMQNVHNITISKEEVQ